MKTLLNSGVRRGGPSREILILILTTALLLALGYVARPAISSVVVPSLTGASRAGGSVTTFFGGLSAYFKNMNSLIAENRDLSEKLRASQTLVLDRNVLYEENISLKERFGRDVSPNILLAAVLVRPGETPYDTLLIDVGEDKGVREGDRATAGGTLLIGKVDEVYPHMARVLLYSSPGEKYEGFLRGTIPVEVVGQGGGSLRAEVPYDSRPVEGDTISLPSLEANVAFVVEYVEAGRGDSASVAYLRLPVSPFELKYVEVWRTEGSGK